MEFSVNPITDVPGFQKENSGKLQRQGGVCGANHRFSTTRTRLGASPQESLPQTARGWRPRVRPRREV